MQSSHLRILGEKPIRWLTKEIIKRSMRKVREQREREGEREEGEGGRDWRMKM